MSTPVAFPVVGPEPQGSASARSFAGDFPSQPPKSSSASDPADLRLVIEEDSASRSFIYKTVDVRTGVVVQQVPREEVLRLKSEPSYAPGTVINARG